MIRLAATRKSAGEDPDYVALRLSGDLTPATVFQLRETMVNCAAERSAGVIVDLTSLHVRDRHSLTIFFAFARLLANSHIVPVVLVGPSPHVAVLLRHVGLDRLVPICATMTEAHALVRRPATVRRLTQRLAPVPESIPVGRWITVRACDRWGLQRAAQPAGQLATELIGNAVHHARTPIDLILTYVPPQLRIAVRDQCPRLPRQRTPESAEDHGRGLLLVEALATNHGTILVRDGKVVWAELAAS